VTVLADLNATPTGPAQLVRRYAPRGAARELFTCRAPEVLLDGPAGTGKSRAVLEKMLVVALKYPRSRLLVLRKTNTALASTTLVTWNERVIPEALAGRVVRFYGGSAEKPPQYQFCAPSSSVMVIGGLDNSDKILSSDYDLIFVDEAVELTEDDWEVLKTRLRNGRMPYQQLIGATNPSRTEHWLNRRAAGGLMVRLHSRHTDNPVYFDEAGQPTEAGRSYVLGTLASLTGMRRARLYEGRWVSAEGIVYEGWDPAVHLVDRFPVPAEWPRTWTVDFGFVHPFVLQCWATDPDGGLVLYREIYHTQRLVEDHARDILRAVTEPVPDVEPAPGDVENLLAAVTAGRRRWVEPRPRAVVCDHDAEDRATLERHLGMGTKPARKSVSDGIQAVASRLRAAGNGRPRLRIMRDSVVKVDVSLREAGKPTCTADEFGGYVWQDSKVKDAPVKVDDDGMDAVRYRVADEDLAPRPGIRWM
jgi:phage terminase large subunit